MKLVCLNTKQSKISPLITSNEDIVTNQNDKLIDESNHPKIDLPETEAQSLGDQEVYLSSLNIQVQAAEDILINSITESEEQISIKALIVSKQEITSRQSIIPSETDEELSSNVLISYHDEKTSCQSDPSNTQYIYGFNFGIINNLEYFSHDYFSE